MLINLIGTGLPLVALQLIVYPIVARRIDADAYGRMQSLVSVIFLISGTLGGALSTTRLIHQYDYDEQGRVGDFSLLNLYSLGAVAIATPTWALPLCTSRFILLAERQEICTRPR